MENRLTTTAGRLTDDELEILTQFANGTRPSEIAIFMEMKPAHVVKVIEDKANNQPGNAQLLVDARHPANPAVPAAVHDGPDVLGPGPARRAAPARPAAKKTTAARKTSSTPARTVRAPEVPASAINDPDPAPTGSTHLAPTPVPKENAPEPAAKAPVAVSDLDLEPISANTIDAVDLPDDLEHLLQLGDGSGSEAVLLVVKEIRSCIERLRTSLAVDARIVVVREEIAQMDREINDRISRRDQLRAELEALLRGDVVVSVSSTPRRAEPVEADVRSWAAKNGFEVEAGAKVPGGILAAYRRAHQLAA